MQVVHYEYQRQISEPQGACSSGRALDNEARNRYTDVLPYDETRVCLQAPGASDYINASLLSSRPGEAPFWQFIVTQVLALRSWLSSYCGAWQHLCAIVGCLRVCRQRFHHTLEENLPSFRI